MQVRDIVRGAGRGAAAGLAAGALWWAVETVADWAVGGWMPPGILVRIAALDLAFGSGAGLLVGACLGGAGRGVASVPVALGLAVAFGFLRVFAPPGLGSEAVFAVAAAVMVWVGALLVGPRRGLLAFVHVTLLTTAATVVGAFVLDEWSGEPLSGVRLPLVFAALPLAGLAADRLLALLVASPARRLGAEVAVVALAVVVWGRPLAPGALVDGVVTAVPPPAGTPDVIVVSLDTTRADHLSTYGYARETSPHLTTFAADALRFTQARSTSAWTLPGHASLFTGLYPSRHGARLAGAWLPGQSVDGRRRVAYPLSPKVVTMAEALRDRGYQTAAFVANFSYLYRDFGLAQGFGTYDDAPGLLLRIKPHAVVLAQRFAPGFCLKPFRTAPEINAAALAWLDRAPVGRPAFLFVNYMEPHQPWLAPPPYDRWARGLPQARDLSRKNLYTHAVHDIGSAEREFIAANYDGQVAAMDAALGQLLDALRARGRFDGALVVVTADHGELLGEHGQVGHIGRMLYEGLLRIPLVVKLPGTDRPRGTADTPVQLVDVMPTVLAIAGAPPPPDLQGEALPAVRRPSVAEEEINPFLVAHYGEAYDRAVRAVYDGPWKLITTSRGDQMLFDLTSDPGETTDRSAGEPERVSALRATLAAVLGERTAVASAPQER